MAERFERLFALSSNLYTEGFPIVVSAGALLKDTQTGKIVVQLKFQNISGKTIKALKISLDAFDISGTSMPGVEDYQYLDLSVCNGNSFGSDKAIIMPNNNCRSFAIVNIVVIFSDGTTWNGNGNDLTSLPLPKTLQSNMSLELIKQYKIATTTKAHYIPQDQKNYWICTCGTINKCVVCTNCLCEKNKVFSAYDIPQLTKAMDIRLEDERAEREKAMLEKQEADRQQQIKNAKTKKALAIVIPSLIAIIVFIIVLTSVIIPNSRYNDAVSMMDAGNYDDAREAFLNLNGYKDSAFKVNECLYKGAVAAQAEKDFDSAYSTFVDLGTYSDSKSMAIKCAQEAGDYAVLKKQYDTAVEWYKKSNSTSDINNAKYLYVQANKNASDTTTYYYLKDLKQISYKDTATLYDTLYKINFEFIVNDSPTDYTTHKTSFQYDYNGKIYIHFRVTGGYPGQTFWVAFDGWHTGTAAVKCDGKWNTFTDGMWLTYGQTSSDTTIIICQGMSAYDNEENLLGKCVVTVYK